MEEKDQPNQPPLEEKKEKVTEVEGDESAGASWSGWLSGTLATAKGKSSEMFNYLKQDISEFSATVQEAGRELKDKLNLEESAKTAVSSVGSTMTGILEQVSSVFGVGPDDDDEEVTVQHSKPVTNRMQARIYAIPLDTDIFFEDPADKEDYDKFLATFDFESMEADIAEALNANPYLQLFHSNLVPDRIPNEPFWKRYYYQVHLITEQYKALEVTTSMDLEIDAPIIDESISEEDQTRILSEYEEEIRGEEAGHSRRSSASGAQLSSSSSSSFAFVSPEGDITSE